MVDEEGRLAEKCGCEGDEAEANESGPRLKGEWASGPEPEPPEVGFAYVYAEACDRPGVGHEPVMWPAK